MSFIDQSATASFDVGLAGRGSEDESSQATATISVNASGALLRPVRIKAIRSLSSTRIRVDFSAGVDNNSALADKRNYVLAVVDDTTPVPTIGRVDIPSQSNPLFVELVVSEMRQGSQYVLSLNVSGVTLVNTLVDWDMEASGVAAWTNINLGLLSKTAGAPSGSGTQVLQASGGITGAAQQTIPSGDYYLASGWARSANASAIPNVLCGTDVLYAGTSSTTWAFFGPTLFAARSTAFQLQRSGPGGPVQFDEIKLLRIATTDQITGIAPITGDGLDVVRDPVLFAGIGTKPQIKLLLALSSKSVVVQFTEPVKDAGDLDNVSAYVFDNGLSVVSVLDVGLDSVTLETSEQTEGQLYTLTLTGAIYDQSLNTLDSPATSLLLGFVPGPEVFPLLQLRMYDFLKQALCDADQSDEGKQFIERFFKGPQDIWTATVKTIYDLPKIWSIEDCPSYILPFLKRIVGWTRQLDHITNPLDSETLRRLIAASAPFWAQRGPEQAITDILRLATAERTYILNWFKLRWIIGETQLGEDHDGIDPWILSTPGEGDPDAWTYNVRIVDSGVLNHQLVKDLCRLTRPTGERVLITYLGLYDDFGVDGDRSQWDDESFTTPVTVSNGQLHFSDKAAPDGQGVFANSANAPDWTNYVFSSRAKGTSNFEFTFYRSAETDYYGVAVFPGSNEIWLYKVVAGTPAVITSVDLFAVYGETIGDDVFYTYRIEVSPETLGSSTNRIKVYFDSVQVISTTDSSHAQGAVGFLTSAGGTADFDDVELFFTPAVTDFIDINT